jgi:actin
MDSNPAVVIDNGSGMIKAGIAGEDAPSACFPTVVGCPKYDRMVGADDKNFYVGQDAINKKGVLTLEYPLENGIAKNWDYMEKIWHHTYYNELKRDPSEQPVLLTEAPLNPKMNREKMIDIFFEKFKVPQFYVFTQAVLALYSSGRTTGLVVDSGDGVTHVVVVFDGYSIKHATARMDIAGRTLTEYLQKHLAEDGYNFASSAEKEVAKNIKEKLCYVALDFQEESKAFMNNVDKKVEYDLPDGQKIRVGDVLIRTPECLFQPHMLGLDVPSIQKTIYNSIQKSDLDLRRDLFENITLSGGSTMFDGFQERLNKEISSLVSNNVKVKIIAPIERKYSIWMGGSVLSTLATFQSSWISQEEFQEHGPSIVHRKCF